MKLFVTDKVAQIKIVDITLKLLEDFINQGREDGSYKLVKDLKDIDAIFDYTRDFVNMYFDDNSVEIDKIGRSYVINRIYNSKGGPEVFNVVNSLLKTAKSQDDMTTYMSLDITYEYDFPNLSILNIQDLKTTDIMLFVNRLLNMLNVVMFFDEADITITNIIQVIRDTLISYESVATKPYYKHQVNYLN